MAHLKTTSAVMDALGGNSPIAEITGRNNKAVSQWRRFSAFPANTFVILKSALAVKGHTAPDSLWNMTEAPSAEAPPIIPDLSEEKEPCK
jgi:hypothetical protein